MHVKKVGKAKQRVLEKKINQEMGTGLSIKHNMNRFIAI